ncbi:S-layer homology domain-containing protein [Paenibacillus sp. SI8]|uniref:S-layer homology domain-containing protein n=1 Tax=unclassified Paenibacillus TaxID=185978 RepID=UPI0034663936
MKKKILTLMSALTFAASTGCNGTEIVAASNTAGTVVDKAKNSEITFTDVAGHWAREAIEKAVQKGYVDGYEDGSFRADHNVSRAEFLKMVLTALKEPVNRSSLGAEWAAPYIAIAKDKGILLDSDFQLDKFNEPITRLEMSRIAVRATDKDLQNPNMHMDDNSFMYNATKKGLIQGLAGGELGTDKSTTRAQSVTIIERMLSVKAGVQLEVDKYAVGNAELALKKTNIFSMIPEFSGPQSTYTYWSPDKLTITTPDGNFKGSIDQVVAIDLEDPNDPHRDMLGDINELHWDDGTYRVGTLKPLVKDALHSYVILVKSHVDYNNDTSAYAENENPSLSIYGFTSPYSSPMIDGKLSTLAQVFKNVRGDMNAFIIPKQGSTAPRGIDLTISIPARPPVSDQSHTITSILNIKE